MKKHSAHTEKSLQLTEGQTHLFRALFEDFTFRCVFFCFDSSSLYCRYLSSKKFKSQIFSKTHNRHVLSAAVGLSPTYST